MDVHIKQEPVEEVDYVSPPDIKVETQETKDEAASFSCQTLMDISGEVKQEPIEEESEYTDIGRHGKLQRGYGWTEEKSIDCGTLFKTNVIVKQENVEEDIDVKYEPDVESICERDSEKSTVKYDKKHDADFVCDICKKTFTMLCNLNIHKRIFHPDAQYFECDVCTETFSVLSNLNNHRQIFHGETIRFHCDVCQKSFTQESYLKSHKRWKHDGGKLYERVKIRKQCHKDENHCKCNMCMRSFTEPGHLNAHKQFIHSHEQHTVTEGSQVEEECDNDDKFECDICQQLFGKMSYLNTHRQSHIETFDGLSVAELMSDSNVQKQSHVVRRSFMCYDCMEVFAKGSEFYAHRRSHKNKKIFSKSNV